jgi:hypothetical protein
MNHNNQKSSKSGSAPLSKQQKRQVKQLINSQVELKSFFNTTGFTPISTVGSILKLSSVPQGATQAQRVGDDLKTKVLRFRYNIQVGATGLIAAADEFNTVRVIIFRWLEDDGGYIPTVGNILQASSSTNVSLQLYNFDDSDLYKILYDSAHVVYNTPMWNGAAVTWFHGVGANYVTPHTHSLQLGNRTIHYNIGGLSAKGSLYVLLVSDSAFAPNPSVEFTSALEYFDG